MASEGRAEDTPTGLSDAQALHQTHLGSVLPADSWAQSQTYWIRVSGEGGILKAEFSQSSVGASVLTAMDGCVRGSGCAESSVRSWRACVGLPTTPAQRPHHREEPKAREGFLEDAPSQLLYPGHEEGRVTQAEGTGGAGSGGYRVQSLCSGNHCGGGRGF